MIDESAKPRRSLHIQILLLVVFVFILVCAVCLQVLNRSVSNKYARKDIVITYVETALATNAYRVTERMVIPQLTVPVPLDLRVYAHIHGAETGYSIISVGEDDLYRYEIRATKASNEIVIQVQICMGKAYAVRIISAEDTTDITDLQENIFAKIQGPYTINITNN